MDTAKTFFIFFFAAIIVAVVATSKQSGQIISNLGGALKDVSGGILAPGGQNITTGG